MTGFLALPSELTDEIFIYITSPIDLLNVGLTCKTLYRKSFPSINRYLKISAIAGARVNGYHMKALFAKASTEASIQYLREIEVEQVLSNEADIRNPGPRHIYVAPRAVIDENGDKFNLASGVLVNIYLRHLLSQLSPGQLRKFRFSASLTPAAGEPYQKTGFFDETTLLMVFSPKNMLTTLDLSFCYPLSSDCSVFHLPHLASFTFRSGDFPRYYHSIFSILHGCQKTLKELYCYNEREQLPVLRGNSMRRRQEMAVYMKSGYEKWKVCTKCCLGTEKRIRLAKLSVWRISGMSPMMTQVFAAHGLVKDAPLEDVEVAIGSLAFIKLKNIGGRTLQLDRLLLHADGSQKLPDSSVLESYFLNVKGFVRVTLNFYYTVGLGWLAALQQSAETLRELHLTSVYGAAEISEDEIAGLGKSLQNLEMLTINSKLALPHCILHSNIFPRLKYFGNRANLKPEECSKQKISGIIRGRSTSRQFSTSLRIIRFRLPTQCYLIQRDPVDGIQATTVEDLELNEFLNGVGELPKFG